MEAKDKRLDTVLMSTKGDVSEKAFWKAERRIRRREMNTQWVSAAEDGFETVLVFEIYNDCAPLIYRIGYRVRKLLTTAMMKLNGNKIVVRVVIDDETNRFPMHGAFH